MHRILALVAALAIATSAQAFGLAQAMRVTPLGGPDFQVEFRPGAADTDYWCAAGHHVKQRLGMNNKTRIYRLTPEPRKRGQGIGFTLDKARSTGSTGITTYGGLQDGGMSAGSAYQFCADFEIDQFGFGN
ncbi:MAG: hypothetical protein ACT4OK_05465 [Gemmobacter sp.]